MTGCANLATERAKLRRQTVSISRRAVENPGGKASFNTTVEVGYVGRKGVHQQRERNINQLQPGTLQANPVSIQTSCDRLRGLASFASQTTTRTLITMDFRSAPHAGSPRG